MSPASVDKSDPSYLGPLMLNPGEIGLELPVFKHLIRVLQVGLGVLV